MRTATGLNLQKGKADGQRGVGEQSVFTSVCVSAGRRAGKSCAECVRLGASWPGVSPPTVVPVCVCAAGISVSVYEWGGGSEQASGDV